MKTVAIIQVRLGSTRLPAKAMLSLAGKPALQHLIERVDLALTVDHICVAATTEPEDNVFLLLRNQMMQKSSNNWILYQGSRDDVMGRIQNAAKQMNADVIVSITGDCPMVDPRHIDRLVKLREETNSDVATNIGILGNRTWPDGLDILVFTREALNRVDDLVDNPTLRQHVGWNMCQYVNNFSVINWPAQGIYKWPDLGLTLDEIEDYVFLSRLFDRFYGDPMYGTFKVEDVIRYLKKNPSLVFNREVRRKNPEEG